MASPTPVFPPDYAPANHASGRDHLADETCEAPDRDITHEEHRERDDLWPWNGGLHAHHMEPVDDFADPDDAHTVSNLQMLCDPHHKQAERGELTVN